MRDPSNRPSSRRRRNARLMQLEAGGWGIMRAINDAFIQPLLIASGAGQLLLGLYISASSLLNFGAGWLGPTLAARIGTLERAAMISAGIGRSSLCAFAAYLLFADDRNPLILIALILVWAGGEGLALPLWTSFISGLVSASDRGQWLALRGTSATLFAVPMMAAISGTLLLASRDRVLPVAYVAASGAAVGGFLLLRRLFHSNPPFPLPPGRSVAALPSQPGARRFLAGVATFWFGAALTWPILPRYILQDLDAPTVYFAITQILGGAIGVVVQPRWGRMGDAEGARRVLLLCGIGSALVPLLWALAPTFWVGFAIDTLGFAVWPGHLLGLTMRAVEIADAEHDRPSLLGWTNLAQGGGACLSPLIASAVVGTTGVAAVFIASLALRLGGTVLMAGRLPRPARRAA